jgi:type IV fimbrial biogenesis protein FimT
MSPNRRSGFSLLELMVTVFVLAILSAVAYPSMRDMLRRNKVVAQSNNIQSDLQLARGQAAATRRFVSVCPRATGSGTACDTSSADYGKGWLVYSASSSNVAYASSTDVLQHVVPAEENLSLRASADGVLTFNARGELLVDGTVGTSVTFLTCSATGGDEVGTSTSAVPGIRLEVASSGRIASGKIDAGGSCE